MSIFIRDTHQNLGADTNSNYVGRTQQDNISLNNALTNPDFILSSPFSPPAQDNSNQIIPQISITHLKKGGTSVNYDNTISYPGIIEMSIYDFLKLLYPEASDFDNNELSSFIRSKGIISIYEYATKTRYQSYNNYNTISSLIPGKSVLNFGLTSDFDDSLNFTPDIISHYQTQTGIYLSQNEYLEKLNQINFKDIFTTPTGYRLNLINIYISFPCIQPQEAVDAIFNLIFPLGHPGGTNNSPNAVPTSSTDTAAKFNALKDILFWVRLSINVLEVLHPVNSITEPIPPGYSLKLYGRNPIDLSLQQFVADNYDNYNMHFTNPLVNVGPLIDGGPR
jgi:hypothetical protein